MPTHQTCLTVASDEERQLAAGPSAGGGGAVLPLGG